MSRSTNVSFLFSQKLFVDLFSVINDQPLVANGCCFLFLSFLCRSKTRTMSAKRADKRAIQAMQRCGHGYALYEAALPRLTPRWSSRVNSSTPLDFDVMSHAIKMKFAITPKKRDFEFIIFVYTVERFD